MQNADYFKCQRCGVREHIDLLDAKPSSGDENDDFDRLECVACYGPGWCPASGTDDFKMSAVPRYWWRYRLWQFREWLRDLRSRSSRRFA
jgi:hypothetical protein